jgi:hypothetical protein
MSTKKASVDEFDIVFLHDNINEPEMARYQCILALHSLLSNKLGDPFSRYNKVPDEGLIDWKNLPVDAVFLRKMLVCSFKTTVHFARIYSDYIDKGIIFQSVIQLRNVHSDIQDLGAGFSTLVGDFKKFIPTKENDRSISTYQTWEMLLNNAPNFVMKGFVIYILSLFRKQIFQFVRAHGHVCGALFLMLVLTVASTSGMYQINYTQTLAQTIYSYRWKHTFPSVLMYISTIVIVIYTTNLDQFNQHILVFFITNVISICAFAIGTELMSYRYFPLFGTIYHVSDRLNEMIETQKSINPPELRKDSSEGAGDSNVSSGGWHQGNNLQFPQTPPSLVVQYAAGSLKQVSQNPDPGNQRNAKGDSSTQADTGKRTTTRRGGQKRAGNNTDPSAGRACKRRKR